MGFGGRENRTRSEHICSVGREFYELLNNRGFDQRPISIVTRLAPQDCLPSKTIPIGIDFDFPGYQFSACKCNTILVPQIPSLPLIKQRRRIAVPSTFPPAPNSLECFLGLYCVRPDVRAKISVHSYGL